MRLLPRIHDVYVARSVVGTVLLTWAVLLGLDVMINLVGEVEDFGKGRYGFTLAVAYMAHTVPFRMYQLFPSAAVIGSLMALGQLAASSELTALRALGLSRRRISLTIALTLSALLGAMVVNGETLAPWAQRRGDALKASAKSRDMIVAQYSGLWAREGEVILNANGGQEHEGPDGERWLELREVRLFEFHPDGRLKSLAKVDVAEHREGRWRLRGVTRTHFAEKSVRQERVGEESWQSRLDAVALTAGTDKPRYLTARKLREAIEYRERNGLDAGEMLEHYWGRWFYPLNALALVLAAVPFAFGTLRSGGLGRRLFIGIVFALGFGMLQMQSVRAAGVYKFDYRIAYALPTVVMVAVSMWLFRRRSG
ncbi:MAG TPA: LPS export ABC transporter permease LptG [Lysobacter sp.]|nr:LPS export ABC transporter permease LptG [Lysobacter sp.]